MAGKKEVDLRQEIEKWVGSLPNSALIMVLVDLYAITFASSQVHQVLTALSEKIGLPKEF